MKSGTPLVSILSQPNAERRSRKRVTFQNHQDEEEEEADVPPRRIQPRLDEETPFGTLRTRASEETQDTIMRFRNWSKSKAAAEEIELEPIQNQAELGWRRPAQRPDLPEITDIDRLPLRLLKAANDVENLVCAKEQQLKNLSARMLRFQSYRRLVALRKELNQSLFEGVFDHFDSLFNPAGQ